MIMESSHILGLSTSELLDPAETNMNDLTIRFL